MPQTADRGIGGTGIVGVITGFGSICINGREVAYGPSMAVLIEGAAAGPEALRTGQVVAIEAEGDQSPRARKVSVFYQVSGPIDLVADARVFRIAGQPVVARAGAIPQGMSFRVGDWVTVSGLQTPTGEITATRLDRRERGRVMLRGRLFGAPGAYRIGTLPVHLPAGSNVAAGQFVVARGSYDGETLTVDSVTADLLATDPLALFDPGVSRFSIESFASLSAGRLQNSAGWIVPLSPGVRDGLPTDRPVVIELQRGQDGQISATGLFNAPPSSLGPPGLGFPARIDRPGLPPGHGLPPSMGSEPSGGMMRPGPFLQPMPGGLPGLPSGGMHGGPS